MPRPAATSTREHTPVEIPEPPQRGPLKRSNSTTSIHSLPTPPRTRKRKRSHSRATDSDSESEGLLSDSDAEDAVPVKKAGEPRGTLLLGHKRRKMLQVDKIAAELSAQAAEDAFWGVATVETTDVFGGPLFGAKGKARAEDEEDTETKADAKLKSKAKVDKAEGSKVRERSESPDLSPSSTPPSRLIKATTGTGLLSPPQSRRRSPRKKAAPTVLPPVFEEAVVTPPPKLRVSERLRKKQQPERDSPNNPFLDSPAAESVASSEPKTPVRPSRGRRVEKPTITYVFRGVRVEFENPLYDPRYPETGVAPPSSLPLEHDDYEADEACTPKVLFPEAHAKLRRRRKAASEGPEASTSRTTTKGKKPARKTRKSEWDTTDEEDNADEDLPPLPRTPLPRDKRLPPLLAHVKAAEPRAEARAGPSQPRSKKPVSVGEPMMTRSRATPQLPEKDRSDPARRALGAHEKTRPARK